MSDEEEQLNSEIKKRKEFMKGNRGQEEEEEAESSEEESSDSAWESSDAEEAVQQVMNETQQRLDQYKEKCEFIKY